MSSTVDGSRTPEEEGLKMDKIRYCTLFEFITPLFFSTKHTKIDLTVAPNFHSSHPSPVIDGKDDNFRHCCRDLFSQMLFALTGRIMFKVLKSWLSNEFHHQVSL